MRSDEQEDLRLYVVVKNSERQYSIWDLDKSIPKGWHKVGMQGLKADCLRYIEETWTDLRPLSLKRHMESSEG